MNELPLHRSGLLPLLTLLLLIGGFGWAPGAWAGVSCTANPATPLTLTFSSQTLAAPSTAGAFGPVASVTVSFTCSGVGGPNAADIIATQLATYAPGGGGLLFSTNRAGISLLVTTTPTATLAGSGPTTTLDFGLVTPNNQPFSVTFNGQFYATAIPVESGNINLPTTLFGQFQYGSNGATVPFPSTLQLLLSSGVTITGSCTVNSPANLVVALPDISATALAGPAGTTAGVTPFNLSYSCPAGTTAIPSMTSTMADPTIKGLMDPVSGNATNVGLRVMNSGLTDGVDLKGANQPSVVSSGTTLTLPYYVEYYRTSAAPISAGPVTGTVTYTLSYQ